jgi:hypothetical protein
MTETKHDYPEHEKLMAIADKSQICGEFLNWLISAKGFCLAQWDINEGLLYPAQQSTQRLLAEFFGIDQMKIDQEKQQMLDAIRRRERSGRESN